MNPLVLAKHLPRFIKDPIKQQLYRRGGYKMTPGKEGALNVCHERRFIYIHIPKCAGSSMLRWLWPERKGFGHLRPEESCHRKTWERYFSFAIVRDPYDRLMSAYYFTLKRAEEDNVYQYRFVLKLTLGEFFDCFREMNNPIILPQVVWLSHRFSTKPIDCLIFYEQLTIDLAPVNEWGEGRPFPHLNKSNREGARSCQAIERIFFEDKKLLKKVDEYYHEDFIRLGYRKIGE